MEWCTVELGILIRMAAGDLPTHNCMHGAVGNLYRLSVCYEYEGCHYTEMPSLILSICGELKDQYDAIATGIDRAGLKRTFILILTIIKCSSPVHTA